MIDVKKQILISKTNFLVVLNFDNTEFDFVVILLSTVLDGREQIIDKVRNQLSSCLVVVPLKD